MGFVQDLGCTGVSLSLQPQPRPPPQQPHGLKATKSQSVLPITLHITISSGLLTASGLASWNAF